MPEVSSEALMAPLVDGSMGSHTVAVMCAFAPISRGALMRVAGASRPRVVRWWHALPPVHPRVGACDALLSLFPRHSFVYKVVGGGNKVLV